MEVYASVLFLLSTILVIVCSKSIQKLVAESDEDSLAEITLKARIKSNHPGNDVNISTETLLDVQDLREIINVILSSPRYNNKIAKVGAVQNEVPLKVQNEDPYEISKEAEWEKLVQRIHGLTKLRSDMKDLLRSDCSEKKLLDTIRDLVSTQLTKFDAVFPDLFERSLVVEPTQLEMDERRRRTMLQYSQKMNLVKKLLHMIEESSELAAERPISNQNPSQYFDSIDYATAGYDRRNFHSNQDLLEHRLSELSRSVENLQRDILVHKSQTARDKLVVRLNDQEAEDPLPIPSTRNASEYHYEMISRYNHTQYFIKKCTLLPIDEGLIPTLADDTKRDGVLVRSQETVAHQQLNKFAESGTNEVETNDTVEPVNGNNPVMESTTVLPSPPTRPSLEQQIKEDREEHLHGARNAVPRKIVSSKNVLQENHTAAEYANAAKILPPQRLKLVEKMSVKRKQVEGFYLPEESRGLNLSVQVDHFSDVKDKNGGNAGQLEKGGQAVALKLAGQRENESSENQVVKNATMFLRGSRKFLAGETSSDESIRQRGNVMQELIRTVHEVVPPSQKHAASSLKLKSRSQLTRSNYKV